MKTEKTSKKTNNRKKRGFKLFSRTHRVAAHLAHERDWQTDIPDIKLSRAFVFVLMLHVVAVVGILAFEFFKPDLAMEPLAGTTAAEEKLAEIERNEEKKHDRSLRDTSDGYYRYTVKSGDSLEKISDRYDLDRHEITKLNKVFSDGSGIRLGTILRLPISEEEARQRDEERIRLAKKAEEEKRKKEERERMEKEILSKQKESEMAAGKMVLTEAAKAIPATPELIEGEEKIKLVSDDPALFVPVDATFPKEKAEKPKKIVKEVAKTVPDPPKTVAEPPKPEEKKQVASRTYKVQPNDTLYGIGRRFGVSHSKILAENGLSDPRKLRIGQVLRIPQS